MNRKRWLTGASTLFVLAMLAACGGGGGDGSTAAPTPDNVAGFAYVSNADSTNVSAFAIDATTGALTSIGATVTAGISPYAITTTRKMGRREAAFFLPGWGTPTHRGSCGTGG